MFGKKQRIIETQAALIADLKEEIAQLMIEKSRAERDLKDLQRFCMNYAADIDFPNSQKGGSNNSGAINVSDILQN